MNYLKKLLLLILWIVFLFNVGCNRKTPQEKLPNIIYVLADDLGYGDLSCFNENSKIKTPHLDKLTSEGMQFTDAHTSSAVCTPTRYGILTGRYNWRSPLKSSVLWGKSKALIPTDRETVASLLKNAGYYTGYIGKWHLGWNWAMMGESGDQKAGDPEKLVSNLTWTMDEKEVIDFSKPVTHTPNDLGFDYAYGHVGSLDMAPYVYVENGMVTAIPDSIVEASGSYAYCRKGDIAPDFDLGDVTPNFFRRAIAFVKDHANKEKPFFLYLPLPSPHTPILPTKEWQGKSGLNPYGDFVMMIDGYMGQLLTTIKEAGIEGNTLVVFTSDNGCSPQAKFDVLGEKGHDPSYIFRGHKADIFEGGHRVPFIMKWPSRIKAGSTSGKTICTTDFMATCAEIIGVSLDDNAGEDSYSMLPLFDNTKNDDFKREYTIHSSINGSFSIRKGEWKLNLCPGSGGWSKPRPKEAIEQGLPKVQLYNLSTDIAEENNLYDKNPEKVKELYNLLMTCIENGRSTQGEVQANDPSSRGSWPQFEKLQALDY